MKKKKAIKIVLVSSIALIIVLLIFLIYKNLFADKVNSRYKDISKYELTNDEINCAQDMMEEIENVDTIKVYKSSKIIKIMINLKVDTDFNSIKLKSKEVLSCFKEKNLTYYDLEIFINGSDDSELYPKIGYKHKTKEDFTW